MAYHHYFEQELIDLQQEVCTHHPDVLAILTSLTDQDIYIQISAIAVHCKMILHGDYTKEDILKICRKLTEKLVEKRTIHLISGVEGVVDLVEDTSMVKPDFDSSEDSEGEISHGTH